MTTATEPTHERRCRIEGLLEGPLPPVPGFAHFLEDWRARLSEQGVSLVVQAHGGRFDVLAPELDLAVPKVGRDPAACLDEALRELVAKVPSGDRVRLHSTLRTVEYGDGLQRRTLFALRETGELVRVEESAEGAPPPLADFDRPGALHWTFWAGLVLVAVVLVMSGPRLVEQFRGAPLVDVEKVVIDSAPGGFELVSIGRDPLTELPVATIAHTADFATWSAPSSDALAFRLAVERGRAVVEWRDEGGALLRVDPLDVGALATETEATVTLLEPPRGAVAARLAW
jgi:hypothetical protein